MDKVDIVVPSDATSRELFAAEELKKYLELMLDANVNITGIHKKRNIAVIIGGPSRNAAAGEYIYADTFRELVPGPEGANCHSTREKAVLSSIPRLAKLMVAMIIECPEEI